MIKETAEWGGYTFVKATKKEYNNFLRFFKNKVENDFFMDWDDTYDWSLNGNAKIKTEEQWWENKHKCMVARHYCDRGEEFWIRLDYIQKNNYDLKTIVPKESEEKPTKLADVFAKALDEIFVKECQNK